MGTNLILAGKAIDVCGGANCEVRIKNCESKWTKEVFLINTPQKSSRARDSAAVPAGYERRDIIA